MFYLDMHCHILPGVDDGSVSMDMSMAMLDFAYDEGIRALILTPHYHGGYVETNRQVIDETFDVLKDALNNMHPDMKLFIGNEIYYYSSVPEWIEEGRVHTLADSDYVLLEFANSVKKRELIDAVKNLLSHGYYPVLAHVERYDCLVRDPLFVGELIDKGAYIQVNARSVTGADGMKIKHFIKKLLREEWVHFIGTDAHSMGGRRPEIADCADYIIKKYGEEYAAGVLYKNAVHMIRNQPL